MGTATSTIDSSAVEIVVASFDLGMAICQRLSEGRPSGPLYVSATLRFNRNSSLLLARSH